MRSAGTALSFVYLDFDGAAIQPRDPRQLLLEVARQVALQFKNIAPGLAGCASASGNPLTDTAAVRSATIHSHEFRAIVTTVTKGERALLWSDTIEIVQADQL